MPAKNPRITITLQPATSAQIAELSRLTGSSQSSIISEILEQSAPVFTRLIRVLDAADQAKTELKTKMAADLDRAQSRIESQLGLVLDDFDEFTGGLLDEVETVRRRARRAPTGGAAAHTGGERRALSTPPSNRGVRSTANPLKKAKATKGRE